MVFGSEESQAISQAQQLLVIIYYSGPQFLVEHLLQSPVRASLLHFYIDISIDICACCELYPKPLSASSSMENSMV